MDPNTAALATMCGHKQRHASRREARVEVIDKTRSTGRKHETYGCPFCMGIHVRVASPSRGMRQSKARRHRRGWTPQMGA